MSIDTEQKIRDRAYVLWDGAGRPDGHDKEFWLDAERQLCDAGDLDLSDEQADVGSPPILAGLPIH